MDALPSELVAHTIQSADDFLTLLSLYNTYQEVRDFFKCQPAVALISFCSSPTIQRMLRWINQRYGLNIQGPLTFDRCLRAYERSALNPTCFQFANISRCTKSSVKLGSLDSLQLWLDQISDLNPDVVETISISEEINTWQLKLADIAYRHHQAAVGDQLYYRSNIFDGEFPQNFYLHRTRCHVREILTPYRLSSNRQLREVNYADLYNPNIPDSDKATIWSGQYDLTNFPPLDLIQDLIDTKNLEFWACALIKVGLVTEAQDLAEDNYVDMSVAIVDYATVAGDWDLVDEILQQISGEDFEISGLNSIVKLGYFERAQDLLDKYPQLKLDTDQLYAKLSKFSLVEVTALLTGLMNTGLMSERDIVSEMYKIAVQQGYVSLFQELMLTYPLSPSLQFQYLTQRWFAIKSTHLIILTTILSNNEHLTEDTSLSPADIDMLYSNFQELLIPHNLKFLAQIWIDYGKDQFLSSLSYLQSYFRLKPDPAFTLALFQQAIEVGCLGLVAYLLGLAFYTPDARKPITGSVKPLETEPALRLNIDVIQLSEYIEFALQFHHPDIVSELLIIINYMTTGKDRLG